MWTPLQKLKHLIPPLVPSRLTLVESQAIVESGAMATLMLRQLCPSEANVDNLLLQTANEEVLSALVVPKKAPKIDFFC